MNDKPFSLKQSGNGASCSCTLGPEVALMCPKCFEVYRIHQSGSVFAAADVGIDLLANIAYHIGCVHCGASSVAITIDPPIAKAVSELNKLGYKTEMCCSGHSGDKHNNAFIKFVQEYNFKTLPAGWERDGVFIRSLNNSVSVSMYALACWVSTLQNIGD